MQDEEILEGLEKLLAELSIDLRYDKGEFIGGIYRYYQKEQLLVNNKLNTGKKIQIIARELYDKLDLQNMFIVPAIREVIENAGRVE